jgi:hypothetical protein
VTTPKSVIRVWLPTFFSAGLCLFLSHMPLAYWLLALPLLPIVIFMITLADVKDEGQEILVNRLWISTHIPKGDVLATNKSFLDGIGVLHLKRFAFPFGRIYFVPEWSTKRHEKQNSSNWDLLGSAALAISGFVAARAVNIHGLTAQTPNARALALALAGALCFSFAATRQKKPGLANGMLFAAAYIMGLVRL